MARRARPERGPSVEHLPGSRRAVLDRRRVWSSVGALRWRSKQPGGRPSTTVGRWAVPWGASACCEYTCSCCEYTAGGYAVSVSLQACKFSTLRPRLTTTVLLPAPSNPRGPVLPCWKRFLSARGVWPRATRAVQSMYSMSGGAAAQA